MGKFNNDGNGRDRGDRGRGGGDRGRGGRGGGGRGRGGPPKRGGGGSKVFIQPHRLPGVYIARGPQDALVTKNLVPG